jgi:hypothetical protein
MKHYQSVRYAYLWWKTVARWDPQEGYPDCPKQLKKLYAEYKKLAQQESSIQTMNFETWQRILERIPVMFEHSRHSERIFCILAG